MNEDFNKKMNQYISKKLESESASSKESIWNRLDINDVVTPPSSRIWKMISAVLLLLLLQVSALYFCNESNRTNQIPLSVVQDEVLSKSNHLLDENNKLKNNYTLLKDSLIFLKNKLDMQGANNVQSITYKDRLIYKKDTVYIKSDPIIKYKDIIVRDTIYTQEPPIEQLMASTESKMTEEKSRRRNVVLFDLRNQVNYNTQNNKEESKASVKFSLNAK